MKTICAVGFEMFEARDVKRRKLALALFFTLTLLAAWANIAAATGAGTSIGALPWEKTLSGIAYSLTGPVALALSLVMVVVGIGVLMFGGDMAGWARWVAFAALAAGTLGGAANLISLLGVKGALV
jgi:type IV secretory pathway VirB2 component (pilin)